MEKKKSGKKIAAARLTSILATRCTGNRIFYGQPKRRIRVWKVSGGIRVTVLGEWCRGGAW